MRFRKSVLSSAIILSVLGLAACGGSDDDDGPASVTVGDTIVLTTSGRLQSFNRAAPATQLGSIAIKNLAGGESIVGIDVRPADGKLYGLSTAGNVYQLDPATGMAALKSTLRAAAGDDNPYAVLSGTEFAIDFNPVADRLRVVSNTGQNLRVNVDTGDAITDGVISPAGSTVTAAAYTNSFAGTTSTQLFDLDVATGRVQLQDPPNDGVLNAGVPLGLVADAVNGFDIDPRTNTGYAVLRVGGETALYSINVGATAQPATRVAALSGTDAIRGLALAATTAPAAIALTADNKLLAFDPKAPNTITSTTNITGLGAGEAVLGMDFRPKDGLLYALASGGKLYTVDPASGAATLRATLTADPTDTTAPYAGLTGTSFSVDFNPVADRLRVIGNDGQSLRIAVETTTGATPTTAGRTITDGVINRAGGTATVAAAAYTNSFAGATATALYDIEQSASQLALQNPPNDGTLVNVGPLGVGIAGPAAFDIAGGSNGLALAALRAGAGGPFTLYTVSLTTGAATLYRNTTGNAALSLVGGAAGPGNVIDLAIRF